MAAFGTMDRSFHLSSIGEWVSFLRAGFFGGPSGRTYVLVGGAVVLWASWPALATIAYPAPPFLVLGLAAFVGFVFSYLVAARRKQANAFFAVRKRTMLFVAFGLMGNNAFYLAAITRIEIGRASCRERV